MVKLLNLQLCVEEVYILAILDSDNDRRNDLLKRFIEIAVKNSFHFQSGYNCYSYILLLHKTYRFAAFYLSAFPNTSAYMIPQGVLQGAVPIHFMSLLP